MTIMFDLREKTQKIALNFLCMFSADRVASAYVTFKK